MAFCVHDGPCVHRSGASSAVEGICLPPNIGEMEKYSSHENCAKYTRRPERTRTPPPPPPRLHKLAELEKIGLRPPTRSLYIMRGRSASEVSLYQKISCCRCRRIDFQFSASFVTFRRNYAQAPTEKR